MPTLSIRLRLDFFDSISTADKASFFIYQSYQKYASVGVSTKSSIF
jgi:hypothetical protein